jgi:Protein of unknown function (DUF1838)
MIAMSLKELDAQQWVKTRCALDRRAIVLTWNGTVYSFFANEPKKRLFKIVGMNVCRCIADGTNCWQFTSRELMYYLDPNQGDILDRWENPWTGEIVPVVHVANSPVQGQFQGLVSVKIEGNLATFSFDFFPHFANPLANDRKFAEYSPQPTYQAAELFKFSVPSEELLNSNLASVSQLTLSWDRIGPWLPWMKMGNKPGYLVYSATGLKVNSWIDLPQVLKTEIETRVPLYKDAPTQFLDRENMTSWTYFKENFDAYLRGEQFPIAEEGDIYLPRRMEFAAMEVKSACAD